MEFHSQNEEKRLFYQKVLFTAYHGRFKVLRLRSSAGRVFHQLDLQTSTYPLLFLTLFHPTISPNNSFLVSTACMESLVLINFSADGFCFRLAYLSDRDIDKVVMPTM